MASVPNRPICEATRRDGQPCSVPALAGEARCFAHSERTAGLRAEARKAGGRNSARSARLQRLVPTDLRPSLTRLFEALEQVHRGELDPRAAGAMAALAGAIARLYQTSELEQRLRDLEERSA